MAVTTRSIVERLDVVGHISERVLAIPVDVLLDPLLLQAAEEGFRNRIVPTVAFTAHAQLKMIGATEASPGIAAVLGTLIGMDQRAAWPSSAYGC